MRRANAVALGRSDCCCCWILLFLKSYYCWTPWTVAPPRGLDGKHIFIKSGHRASMRRWPPKTGWFVVLGGGGASCIAKNKTFGTSALLAVTRCTFFSQIIALLYPNGHVLIKNQDFSRWANDNFKISQDGTFANRHSHLDAVHFFCLAFLLSWRRLVQVFDFGLIKFHDFSVRTLLPEAQKEQTLHAFMLPPSLTPTRFACFWKKVHTL